MRIVSLLPSTTEILFAVGAGDDVVGVTFECDYPPQARTRRIVSLATMPAGLSPAEIDAHVRERIASGGELYRLDEGALRVLDPDLVVTQDLCAVCAVSVGSVAAALDYLGCDSQVLTIDPGRLDDVLASIDTLGSATGNEGSARQLVAVLRERLARVAVAVEPLPRPRVAALEWPDPPFNAGHWVPDMIVAAGGEPVLGAAGERSVQVDWSALAECRPDVVVVSPCGYHLDDAHRVATDLVGAGRLPPGVPVWAVDADAAFVRPGPRLVDGVEGLAAVLHPQRLPARPDITRYAGTTPAIGARHA